MDLNILYEPCSAQDVTVRRIIERAFEFDFECVAINTVIPSSSLSGKNITIPDPPSIDFTAKPGKKCRVVSRLTAIIEDNIHSHHLLKHPSTKKYDILAIQPVGEKVLQHVCSSLDVDIISLDLTKNLGYRLKKKCLGQAIRKGAYFEISYAPCLRDQSSRRMVISNAQLLIDVTRGGRNVIVSSGASKLAEVRAVEDVINLGLLFGLQLDRSSGCVRKNGSLVLAHAATRNKSGCGFVSLSGRYRMPKHQGWIVKACKVSKATQITPSSSAAKNNKKKKKNEAKLNNINQEPECIELLSPPSTALKRCIKEEENSEPVSKKIKQEHECVELLTPSAAQKCSISEELKKESASKNIKLEPDCIDLLTP